MKYFNNIPIFISENNKKYNRTNINIHDAEKEINRILDKHNELAKYYLVCNEAKWVISFNVNMQQFDIMTETMFEIFLFQDENENSVFYVSNEINEHEQWSPVLKSLDKFFYNNLIKKFDNLKI
jgi:hypothetical protein